MLQCPWYFRNWRGHKVCIRYMKDWGGGLCEGLFQYRRLPLGQSKVPDFKLSGGLVWNRLWMVFPATPEFVS